MLIPLVDDITPFRAAGEGVGDPAASTSSVDGGRRLLGAHRLLDPDSRARIEQTIDERKADRTVVVVARNMQQAASVSDFMAFMLLGRMIEFARRQTCFNRGRTNHEAIRYGQVR